MNWWIFMAGCAVGATTLRLAQYGAETWLVRWIETWFGVTSAKGNAGMTVTIENAKSGVIPAGRIFGDAMRAIGASLDERAIGDTNFATRLDAGSYEIELQYHLTMTKQEREP